jgi:hypothetical protein
MQVESKERKVVVKKTHKILLKGKKKRTYELGQHGPFKPSKRSKSISKKVKKIKIMK